MVFKLLTLFVIEQFNAAGALMQRIQIGPGLLMLFENPLGKLAVDLGAGQLFQQFGTIVGIGIEEGGELPLG
ncbi:hypothetical protein D3C81_1074860 [compost metagenome]